VSNLRVDLHVQNALRTGTTLDDLHRLYAIKAKRSGPFPELVLLKYDQINSPMGERIVHECRGIILDEEDNWSVVGRAFDKFFNHGEGHASKIDWATAKVQEKLDGSLAVLYPYGGGWNVATTGTPDASGDVNDFGLTFAEYFWKAFAQDGLRLPDPACRTAFFFEIAGPMNRVVVQHKDVTLTLLGARSMLTQLEMDVASAATMIPGVKVVREFPLNGFEQIAETFSTMSPLSQEGYVVVDGDFNRVKVKHPGYIALHHALGGMSRRAIVEIARSGETGEVCAAFPEFAAMLEEARGRLVELRFEVESDYKRLCDIPEQKAFALEATKTRVPAALFQLRAKRVADVGVFMRDMQIDALLKLVGYKVGDGIVAERAP
jgi:hypothetical protein